MLGIHIPITVCRHQIRLIKRPEAASARHPMFYDFEHQFYSRPEGRDSHPYWNLGPC
jgi:hypothetical protein